MVRALPSPALTAWLTAPPVVFRRIRSVPPRVTPGTPANEPVPAPSKAYVTTPAADRQIASPKFNPLTCTPTAPAVPKPAPTNATPLVIPSSCRTAPSCSSRSYPNAPLTAAKPARFRFAEPRTRVTAPSAAPKTTATPDTTSLTAPPVVFFSSATVPVAVTPVTPVNAKVPNPCSA